MELVLQVIELAKAMPPIVSALLSLTTLVIIYLAGKRILAELGTQSKDLGDIKIQTTKTNGRVLTLEETFKLHDRQDDDRHKETLRELSRLEREHSHGQQ